MLAALKRRRRAPLAAIRGERAERRDRREGRIPPPQPRRKDVRSVVCFLCGPGDLGGLLDSIEALRASDGDATQVLVVDDTSVTAREALVRERFPEVEVLRNRLRTGGPPHLWPLCQLGLHHALRYYSFEQWVKMDADALVTATGFSEQTLARLAAAPAAGMAGNTGTRCDGAPADYRYHAGVLRAEAHRSRTLTAAVERARAAGWELGENVHGGVFCVTRAACEAISRAGWLAWREPWHSLVSEDLAFSLFVRAEGFELLSIGDPNGIFAIANKHLPLPKEEIAGGPWVATHSVRVGLDGESESDLRAFFRAHRSAWPSAPGQ